jgi:transposase
MADETLFPVGDARPKPELPALTARVKSPVRHQVQMLMGDLDSTIPTDHQARTVWAFVEQADLSELYAAIKAVEGHVGRSPIDPRILLCLWIYATLDGVGSARVLERLCSQSLPYRWICGGVSVNYHTLASFRSNSGALFEEVLVDHVAALRAAGAVSLNRVAHDGMRVRAAAGSGSFRRKETLDRFMQEAQEQVDALRKELKQDPARGEAQRKAAQERAARERAQRVGEALRQYADVKKKRKKDKDEARVSTTDPDARKMRMADGGTRPAYNVQISTDTATQIIVGVEVINGGSDADRLLPAVKRILKQHGRAPKEMLADGGFADRKAVESLAEAPFNCTVYMPLPKPKTKHQTVERPFKTETPRVTQWRERMETAEAKAIYKERAATAECVNAQARNRGLQQFRVRGLMKVQAASLLYALAHNIVRAKQLMKAA